MTGAQQVVEVGMRARSGVYDLDVRLFAPEGYESQCLPGIVICHGFGGIKETTSPAIARVYAASGYAAFTFDYRGFGKSEGPRWELDPEVECEDVSAICGFVESQRFIDPDRIGLHGSSYGGGVAVVAASRDRRIRSVVAVASVTDGEKWLRSLRRQWEWVEFMKEVEVDKRRCAAGEPSRRVDPYYIMLSDPEAEKYHIQLESQHPERRFDLPLAAVDRIMRFKPVEHVARLAPKPLLTVGLTDDWLVSVEQSRELHAQAAPPNRLMLLDGVRHHDIYHQPALGTIVRHALAWHDKAFDASH